MRRLRLDIDGETVEVLAQKFKGQLWFHYKGETFTYKPQQNYGGSQSGSVSAEPGVIKSPMPGKIIQVKAVQGREVQAGDPLVIMEAMKMEYTLKADVAGVIGQVDIAESDLVSAGQVLVKVESRGGGE